MIHNHEVPGSIPGPATKKQPLNKLIFDGCFFVLFRDESKRARFENLGSLIILGDLNIISQTKGRISRFPGSAKFF
jgi:hypothetical protein